MSSCRRIWNASSSTSTPSTKARSPADRQSPPHARARAAVSRSEDPARSSCSPEPVLPTSLLNSTTTNCTRLCALALAHRPRHPFRPRSDHPRRRSTTPTIPHPRIPVGSPPASKRHRTMQPPRLERLTLTALGRVWPSSLRQSSHRWSVSEPESHSRSVTERTPERPATVDQPALRPPASNRSIGRSSSEPSVPWTDIAGMRNHLAHRYFDEPRNRRGDHRTRPSSGHRCGAPTSRTSRSVSSHWPREQQTTMQPGVRVQARAGSGGRAGARPRVTATSSSRTNHDTNTAGIINRPTARKPAR